MIKVVVSSAKTGGSTVKRPWLGAKLQNVTPDIAESLGLKRPAGALVATVADKSPAARAGLKTGDLIVAIDGQVVDDQNAYGSPEALDARGTRGTVSVRYPQLEQVQLAANTVQTAFLFGRPVGGVRRVRAKG